jgi:hypothetical protein
MRHLALSALLLTALAASPLPAQELTGAAPPLGVRVESGTTARVEAHDVCRNVDNVTNAPIMIPHRSATEWSVGLSAFLENPYPGVTVSPCETGLCDPDEVVPGDPSLLYTVNRWTTHIYFDGSLLHAVGDGGVRAYSVTETGVTEVATFSITSVPPGFVIVGFGGAVTGPADLSALFLGRNPQTGQFFYRRVYLEYGGGGYSDVTSSYSAAQVTGPQSQTERVSDLHEFRLDASTNEIVITEIATGNVVNSLNHGSGSLSFTVFEDGMNLVVYSSSVAYLYSFDGSQFRLGASLPAGAFNGFLGRDLFWRDAASGSGAEIYKIGTDPNAPTRVGGVSAFSLSSSGIDAWMGTHNMVYASIMNIVRIDGTDLIAVADSRQGMRVMRLETEDCPDPPPPPPATTIYDFAFCSVNASGGDADFSTSCGPDYEVGLDMTFSFEDGTCEAPGLARVRRIVGQNLAASFFHAYLCQEVETGRPGHFHLGEVEAAAPSVPDVTIGGAVHVAAEPFTLSGLTGDAVLSWSVGGWSQGAAVRINGGAWVASETAPAASRTVRNGDRVEFALRTGGADANALNWALLTVTPSGGPELSLTRDFAVRGNRTVSVNPVTDPASGAELVLGNILQTQTGGNMTAYQSAVMFINNLPSMPDVTPGGEIRIDGRDGTVINAEIFGPDCADATGNPTCAINDPGTWSTGSSSYQGFLDLVCSAQTQPGSYSFYLLDVAGMSIGFPTDVRADVFECVPATPLTAGGPVSTTNEAHPVFQLFQSCFQVPPGSHLDFPNACELDASFWSEFETAACAPSPHDLTISMGGFSLGSSGDACSEVGFQEFVARAKVSTCQPASCAITENGPSSCVFSCE